jgi:hypothetical protein
MRRAPKALERERRMAALIAEANRAKDPSPGEKRFRELVEDPAFHSSRRAASTVARPQNRRELPEVPYAELGEGYGQIRRRHQERKAEQFRRVLREIFTMIVNAGAIGPVQPDEIELPDPTSYRRLRFNPDGTGRIKGGDYRDRYEELYGLLDGGLDLTRIKVCLSCKRLFWAFRSDQVGCKRACAIRIRSSRFYYKSKVTESSN